MPNHENLNSLFTGIADAIRGKTGKTDPIVADDFPTEIEGIETGGGSGASVDKDVKFYDYDGTLLYSYTVEEAQALTELPPLPEQEGLICQGWNWTLEGIKSHNRAVNVGAMYITDDGTTRIYITLQEGRTSPMLGVRVNGTVTVDWGDGSEPDILTGTSLSKTIWTPNHEYGSPGIYIIRLSASGSMMFNDGSSGMNLLRCSSIDDGRNRAYGNSIRKIELGNGVTSIGGHTFSACYSLISVTIPEGVTSIGGYAFNNCYSLTSVTIPEGVTSIGDYTFSTCYSLTSAAISEGATSIGTNAFKNCHSLTSVTIPEGVTSIGSNAFKNCSSLASVTIPEGVTSIGDYAFQYCSSLISVTIPEGVTSIGNYAFNNCYSLISVTIPEGVTSIGTNAFYNCYSMRFYDFSKHTAVPILSSIYAIYNIPSDCEIRVPAALYDEWIAATNWATYANYIKAV